MIELKHQYPYVDEQGTEHHNLIKTYAEDEEGNKYHVKQSDTGYEYGEAIDVVGYDEKNNKYYPLYHSYVATEVPVEKEIKEDENNSYTTKSI